MHPLWIFRSGYPQQLAREGYRWFPRHSVIDLKVARLVLNWHRNSTGLGLGGEPGMFGSLQKRLSSCWQVCIHYSVASYFANAHVPLGAVHAHSEWVGSLLRLDLI